MTKYPHAYHEVCIADMVFDQTTSKYDHAGVSCLDSKAVYLSNVCSNTQIYSAVLPYTGKSGKVGLLSVLMDAANTVTLRS